MTEIAVKKSANVKQTFKEKMSNLLEEMWEKIGQHHHGLYATPGKMGNPDADLSDSEEILTYQVELPGMDEDDIEVEVSNGMLSIRGEKRDEREEKSEKYIFQERRYGSFERRLLIPESAKVQEIKADYAKGVLTVTLPYDVEKQGETTKIDVNVN